MATYILKKINQAWNYFIYYSKLNILNYLALGIFFYAGMLWFTSDLLNIDTLCRTCIEEGHAIHCTFSKTCDGVDEIDKAQFKEVGYTETFNKFYNYLIALPFGVLLLAFGLKAFRRTLKKAIKEKVIVCQNGEALTFQTFVQQWSQHEKPKKLHFCGYIFLLGLVFYFIYRFYLTVWGPLLGGVPPTAIAPTDFDWINFAVYPNAIISKEKNLWFAIATQLPEIIEYMMVVAQLITVLHFCCLIYQLNVGIKTKERTIRLKKFTKSNFNEIRLFAPPIKYFVCLAINVLVGALVAKLHYQYMQSKHITFWEFFGKYIFYMEGIPKDQWHTMDTPELFISFFVSLVFITCFLLPVYLIVTAVGKGFHVPLKKDIYQMIASFQLRVLLLIAFFAVLPLYFPQFFIFSVLGVGVCLAFPRVTKKENNENKTVYHSSDQMIFLEAAREIILKNIKTINVDSLAQGMHTNARTLTNWFAATDFTPNHFITHVRLACAKEALEKEENGRKKKIQEIAKAIGYDSSTFVKKFKEAYHITPLQYKREFVPEVKENV